MEQRECGGVIGPASGDGPEPVMVTCFDGMTQRSPGWFPIETTESPCTWILCVEAMIRVGSLTAGAVLNIST